MKVKYLSILACFAITGCGLFDSGSETVVGKYNVCWIDLEQHRSLDYASENGGGGTDIIPYYIFAVGHNNKLIVAKQHPLLNSDHVDVSKTFYWIVDMRQQDSWRDGKSKGVFGPLTKIEYYKLLNLNGIKPIKFDMTYPENL